MSAPISGAVSASSVPAITRSRPRRSGVERAALERVVGLRRVALGDRARALELLGAPALGRVRGLGRRRRRAQAHASRRGPEHEVDEHAADRGASSAGGPSRLTSSIARGSVSGRSRPSRISASSTPPSRPP